MQQYLLTVRPRYWWATLVSLVLASGVIINAMIQALTTPNVEFSPALLVFVGWIAWAARGLNQFIRVTEQSLIIKHSGKPLTIDWAHVAGVGTLQGLMGIAMPYLILNQPYANLPEPNLRRFASANLHDEIVIINPLHWNNTAKLWPLILHHVPATNQYQVPFDFSATPKLERRIIGIFVGMLFVTMLLLYWLF
ncbi:hypothetical protein [Herpetosiphon gulosus]|uniref:PH domain-containing protein n=1 Tax=Herpetosiphon gulosus TaxID=1973496 RepID=A0ABP9X195_9CHLR